MKYLPKQDWSVVSRSTLNDAATPAADRQLSLSADGARLPIIYGRDRRGGLIANIVPLSGDILVQCIWGHGPIDAIEAVYLNDEAVDNWRVNQTHYLGAPGQGVDPWLRDAFAAKGIDYWDTLPGVAYSVFKVGTARFDVGFSALIRGRKLYDPRSGLTAWSANPALVLADFMVSAEYGCNRTVAWSSVSAAANACDAIVGAEPRRAIGLTLDAPQSCDAWVDVLRTYAGCFVVQHDDGWHLIPDRPAAPVATFDHVAGNIASLSPLKKRRRADAPTVMRVTWTDTSAIPWRDRTATAYAPGVQSGTVEWRESSVSLPGIQSASQAYREAVERLNKLSLSDLSCSLEVFDAAGHLEPGDVVSVTHPVGLSDKRMRIVQIDTTAPGRYTLALAEYDPAAYSDAVVSTPSSPDTALPSPANPLAPIGVTVVEEVYQLQDGTYSSRLRVSWSEPDYPWGVGYRIDVRVGGVVVQTGTVGRGVTVWPSQSVQERVHHQIDVRLLSSIGSESPAASATITPQGKYLLPGNVPAITGFEVGGEVRLRWDPAIDIDIWRYELRWGAVGVAWADAALLDRVDALRLVASDIPAGTWDFLVCALDSVGQYSPVPARRTITITSDAGSFLVDSHAFASPSVTGMVEVPLPPGDTRRRWVTDDATAMAARFPDPLSDYGNPLASYAPGPSEWLSEIHDFGLQLTGNWTAELPVTTLSGATSAALELSDDAVTWAAHTGLSAKGTARFARLRASNTGGAMVVILPGAIVRIDAVPRVEEGTATTSASTYTRITLAGSYAASKGLPKVSILGNTPAVATVDNIITGPVTTFDIYTFDMSGNQISRPVGWEWKGV